MLFYVINVVDENVFPFLSFLVRFFYEYEVIVIKHIFLSLFSYPINAI